MTPVLSLLETRVLGVLMEKERTVPDSYPLTLNTLLSGCNQKTSRDPIITATESEVQAALDSLKSMSFVIESSGGRVSRYSHNFERVLQVPRQASALLAILMLRGPQTAGELRINTERLHGFADISSVEAFLNELRDRAAGPLVRELARQAGARENRWVHLLSGEPVLQDTAPAAYAAQPGEPSLGEISAVKAQLARLENEVAELKAVVAKLCSELGVGPDKENV